MTLNKTVITLPLGQGGLQKKINEQVLPAPSLSRADDVEYNEDGLIQPRAVYDTSVYTPAGGTPSQLLQTKEGTLGFVTPTSAARVLPSAVSTGQEQSYPTLDAIFGSQIALPNSSAAPRDLSIAPLLKRDGSTEYLLGWTNPIAPSEGYFGVWDPASRGFSTPPTIVAVNGSAPLPGGSAVALVAQVRALDGTGGATTSAAAYLAISVLSTGGTVNVYRAALARNVATGVYAIQASSAWFDYGWSALASDPWCIKSVRENSTTIEGIRTAIALIRGTGAPFGTGTETRLIVQTGAVVTTNINFTGISGAVTAFTRGLAIAYNGVQVLTTDGNFAQVLNVPLLTASALVADISSGALGTGPRSAAAGWLPARGEFSIMFVTTTGTVGQRRFSTAGTVLGTFSFQTAVDNTAPTPAILSTMASDVFEAPSGFGAAWISSAGFYAGDPNRTLLCYLPEVSNRSLDGKSTKFAVIGRLGYLSAGTAIATPVNVARAAGSYTFALLTGGELLSTITAPVPTIAAPLVTFVQAAGGSRSTTEVPTGTLVAALNPMSLTATQYAPAPFDAYPFIGGTPAQAAGGLLTLLGTYSYRLCYRYVDSNGYVQYSAPSNILTVTLTGANRTVTLSAVGFQLPNIAGAERCWFATAAGGTIFYELGNVASHAIADTVLTTSRPLYTTSGELPNDPPPAATLVVTNPNYAFAVSVEDPTRLYISKPFRANRQVEWNAGQFIIVAPQTGPITGLGVIDDKVIIFKRDTAYVLFGNGYDLAGRGGFQPPATIAMASGCISAKSVVATEQGLFYQSAKGIELLDRGLTVQFLGMPLGPDPIGLVTSTGYLQPKAQVWFSIGATGEVYVYDTIVQRWSRFTNFGALVGNTPSAIFTVVGGAINAAGGTFSQGVIETGWISPAQLQGFMRLYRVGLIMRLLGTGGTVTAPRPIIEVAYNYDPTYVDLVQGEDFSATPDRSGYQLRFRASQQRIESVRFRITLEQEASTTPYGITGISLELGGKGGIFRLPTGSSFSG